MISLKGIKNAFHFAGAMVVICDLNEYRRCVREFQIPLLNTLFETLHALCNLLVVEPSNLKQMCTVDQLVSMNFHYNDTHTNYQVYLFCCCCFL